jgi:hypothetical protein
VVVGAAIVGIVFAARNLASSQENTGVVDFTKVTPFVVGGLDGRTPIYPGTPSHCLAPENEKPYEGLPPLSCRDSGAEPPADLVKTPSPGEVANATGAVADDVPLDWKVINNTLFRFTIAIPPGWYSDMRSEGGAFTIYDATAAQENAEQDQGKRTELPGGLFISFSAREALTPDTHGLDLFPEEKLKNPNADFGGTPGVIWEEPGGENLARIINAAFVREGLLVEIYIGVQEDYPTAASIDTAAEEALAIIQTVRPY